MSIHHGTGGEADKWFFSPRHHGTMALWHHGICVSEVKSGNCIKRKIRNK